MKREDLKFQKDSAATADSVAVVEVIRKNFAGRPHTIKQVQVFGDSARVSTLVDKGGINYMLDKKDGVWVKRP